MTIEIGVAESKWLFNPRRLIDICRQHDETKVALFGLMVREEKPGKSDSDLLVNYSWRNSLLALIPLE